MLLLMGWRQTTTATAMRLGKMSSSWRVLTSGSGIQLDTGILSQKVHCPSALDIEAFGSSLSQSCRSGDVLLLKGDLGSGKTCFARGFIRAMLQDEYLFVTSPSYLLDNTYTTSDHVIIHHMDLYRLPDKFDSSILGIPDIFKSNICLIEWPERLQLSDLQAHLHRTVTVTLEIQPDESRVIKIEVEGQDSSCG